MASEVSTAVNIRPFAQAHLPEALALSQQVGWSQTLEDWRFLAEDAHGYVAILDGRFVGITLYWLFGEDVASIGAVMVDDRCRGQGIAGRLLKRSLEDLEGRSVLLYATAAGLPLYANREFKSFETVEQFQGIVNATRTVIGVDNIVRPFRPELSEIVVQLAEQASGIDRSAVIRSLANRSSGVVLSSDSGPRGFAFYRPYGRGWGLGPVVAEDAAAGRVLIQECLGALSGKFVRIDVPAQLALGAWLEGFGLRSSGSAVGMHRGALPKPLGPFQRIAIATQAMG